MSVRPENLVRLLSMAATMGSNAEREFLDACRHEAGHAVVAVVVGATFEPIEVARLNSNKPRDGRLGGFRFKDEPPLCEGVLVGLAGYTAEDPTISLVHLRKYYGFDARTDIRIVEREVRAYFTAMRPRQIIEHFVASYIRQCLACLRRWLALDASMRAVEAVADALANASAGVLEQEQVGRLCAASGVEQRPARLLNSPAWAKRPLGAELVSIKVS